MSTGRDDSLRRAVAFLEARQLATGEVPVCAGGRPDPSVFPTALAAHALSFTPLAAGVRARCLDFLASEMERHGVWRHWPRTHPMHATLPPDADDTACASAALVAAGRTIPANRELLFANRDRRGLFRTWILTRRELRHPLVLWFFFRRTSAKPFDVDAVVNANVIHYLGAIPEVIAHLIDVLRERRESQCDKWYENPFAVWYFVSRALHAHAPEAGELIERNMRNVAPRNVLDEALRIAALRYWNRAASIDALLAMQLPSGGWPAGALYHGGRKRRRDGTFDAPHPDTPQWGSEELTTAFAIEALARA